METDNITNQPAALALEPEVQATGNSELGQDAFLRMFIAQLENQDPLNPQDATELSAQLATYSQLEQSLKSTEALEGIASKLDTLIELGQGPGTLDPVSLLGRTVELPQETLTLAGQEANLSVTVPDRTRSFGIQLSDEQGNPLTVAVMSLVNEENEPIPFPGGTYQLSYRNGVLQLEQPSGAVSTPVFRPIDPENGEIDPEREFFPTPGRTYQVAVEIENPDGSGSRLPTSVAATVSSVRMSDSGPLLTVLGREVDPAEVTRVR